MRFVLAFVIATIAWGEEAQPTLVLRGRVVDLVEGAVIAGATVRAGDPSDPVTLARTDEGGEYRLSLPVPRTATRLRIAAQASGHAPIGYDVVVPKDTAKEFEVPFRLPPGVTMGGKVIDAEGKAIGGVRLAVRRIIRQEPGDDVPLTEAGSACAVSDDRGEFQVDGIGTGECTIEAFSGGRGGGSWRGRMLGGERVEVRLWPPREGTSRVTREDGGTVEGLEVYAHGVGWRAETRTDAEGRFRLVDAPPGAIAVYIEGEGTSGRGTWEASGALPDAVPAKRYDQRPPPAGTASIRGVVLHEGDREPVAGVEVDAGNAIAVSDDEGAFFLEGLAAGHHHVSAAPPGVYVGDPYAVDVDVAEGEHADGIELVIDFRPARLLGRVVDGAGHAVIGATVTVLLADFSDGPYGASSEWHLEVSIDGTFSQPVESSHPYVWLFASHPTEGWAHSGCLRVDRLDRVGPLSLVLRRPVVLCGTVRDSTGRAVAGASVGSAAIRPYWAHDDDVSSFEGGGSAVSDSAGGYVLLADPRPTAISVSAGGYRGGAIRFLPLVPESADRRLDLVLKSGGRVSGRVRRPDGAPVSGQIEATSAVWPEWKGRAKANVEGAFEVLGIPEGVCRVRLEFRAAGGAHSLRTCVQVDGPRVELIVGE